MEYKNHPGFIAFKASNVKEDVSCKEENIDKDIVEPEKKNEGGDEGKE